MFNEIQQYQKPVAEKPQENKYGTFLFLGIIELFLCLPLGILTLIFNSSANNDYLLGDFSSFNKKQNLTRKFLLAGYVIGLILVLISLVFFKKNHSSTVVLDTETVASTEVSEGLTEGYIPPDVINIDGYDILFGETTIQDILDHTGTSINEDNMILSPYDNGTTAASVYLYNNEMLINAICPSDTETTDYAQMYIKSISVYPEDFHSFSILGATSESTYEDLIDLFGEPSHKNVSSDLETYDWTLGKDYNIYVCYNEGILYNFTIEYNPPILQLNITHQ